MSADFLSEPALPLLLPAEKVRVRTLRVYLLGTLDFDVFVAFQRRLHYEITGDRRYAVLILCEHPPIITV